MSTWFKAIDPAYLNTLRDARTLTVRGIARETGISAGFVSRVLAGKSICRRDDALALTRQLTGDRDAQEISALFVPVLRVPVTSTAVRSVSDQEEVPA